MLAAPERPTSVAAGCSGLVGHQVILSSDSVDPDVFVWDTRRRLVDYAAGHWGSAKSVLEHTWLVRPGTRAVIVVCAADAVHPRYSRPVEDAFGIKMIGGVHHGRYGWVQAEDIHEIRR
jgi:hypothetical protein